MSVGVVMLVHNSLDRAAQVARHWTASGCPVVLHVDKNVSGPDYRAFRDRLSPDPLIRFSKRHRCEWGTWGIVAASQAASEKMLAAFPEVSHVFLASGSCLPLRPVRELVDYLGERPQTDFIESATTSDVPWIIGGLGEERFTLRFPFSWKKRRRLFDKWVQVQRRCGLKRRIPRGLVPHMGSQWWCLSRQTLSLILSSPDRAEHDRFFRRVWIPDESYYQTLARVYSQQIESRSLTLSKFDYQGKPHVFYDDHLQLLRRSDCFVARKIWPQADRLYRAFLTDSAGAMKKAEPNPGKIDRIFAKAGDRRTRGRPGLYMQSRMPRNGRENGVTAHPYSVFQGFSELFEGFETWLATAIDGRVHGHLFAPERAEFADAKTMVEGALSDNAAMRDHAPERFLSNLIWNTRGERQCFQFGPRDNQAVNWMMAGDSNAQISVITGAWAVPLFRSNQNFSTLRSEAARLQRIESEQLAVLRSTHIKAQIRIWTMAEFIEVPMEPLQTILDEISTQRKSHWIGEAPRMVDLTGFGHFLQKLKNEGMHPYLIGDFPAEAVPAELRSPPQRPYLVRP